MLHGPCKDCPDRCVNCHAICEKYIKFKQAQPKKTENVTLSYLCSLDLKRQRKAYKHRK